MSTNTLARATKFCPTCGALIDAAEHTCPTCGARQPGVAAAGGSSEKRILPAAILAFLFGIFGAHRFYVGKTGTAILQLVTLGGLGIWAVIDFILIVVGAFKDAEGETLREWV